MRGLAQFGTHANPVWLPSERELSRSRLMAAMGRWGYSDIRQLHGASVDDPEWFWPAALEDLEIRFTTPYEQLKDESEGPEFARWFVGGGINVVNSCVDAHADGPNGDKAAVIYEGDSGDRRQLTYRQLADDVSRIADGLRELGVIKGDRVALFLPVVPEAVVAFLACARIGAIVVPTFSGYGSEAVANRLHDSGAVVVITADATTRRGKTVALKPIVDQALQDATEVRNVLVVRSSGMSVPMTPDRDRFWDSFERNHQSVAATELDPNDPLMIIYTSGTTGKPKGIVHSHAGYLTKAAIDFGYAFDMQQDDVLGWIADMGWNLGPLMIVGGLHFGATIVLIEGVPNHPTASRLWDIVERNGVTVQGIAPTAARMLIAQSGGAAPTAYLGSLRAFASTGEAWDSPSWRWLYETVGESRLPILNYTGGTEVGGGILSCYTSLPQGEANFSGPLLGMDVAVLDERGVPTVGEVGELALLNTWPGMASGFWNDNERYLNTYWSTHQGVWVHGDLAVVDEDGYWSVLGRSDDTIKIAGRRVGPAEIETAILADPRIVDVAVIGVPDPMRGQKIVAFAVAVDERCQPTQADLHESVSGQIGKAITPADIIYVRTLPKTKNGKTMRRTIRAQYLGQPLGDLSALDPTTPIAAIPTHADIAPTGSQRLAADPSTHG
ncbi:AMP-binding protein [Rhodococcus jostii]|uniref:acetate--CoA ligase n=1 Tax=Rhodococcus jostii TaxID=132919 RepID=A0A1H4JNC1_RHOJO|nr:AMP-binding protein [Rhodococcus jostii]SEB47376.1 acetyl-CoA synthetase [Rhodococcus jostii]